jgi:hypothetical protein
LTYVDLAAKAIGGGTEAVWQRYRGWATACRQGRVAGVLEELLRVPGTMTPPLEGREEKPTDPDPGVSRTIVYLGNHRPRMD